MLTKVAVMYSTAVVPSDLPNRPAIKKPTSGRKTMKSSILKTAPNPSSY